MLHGLLTDPSTCEPLTRLPAWRLALGWLRGLAPDIPLGRHNLYGDAIFAVVQEYETLPAAQCRFESHREHVDLQFTLSGVERIDVVPRSRLQPEGEFSLENDVGFWLPPADPPTSLVNAPGHLAVFYPADAHRPKVQVPGCSRVRKLVIKIPVRLLA